MIPVKGGFWGRRGEGGREQGKGQLSHKYLQIIIHIQLFYVCQLMEEQRQSVLYPPLILFIAGPGELPSYEDP